MRYRLLIVIGLGLSLLPARVGTRATDISGTWAVSIDTGESKPTSGTFAFKQDGDRLSGTYSGPRGKYPVTGTVNGDKVVFSYELTGSRSPVTARYAGTIVSPTKLTGTVEWIGGGAPPGKWTATKTAKK